MFVVEKENILKMTKNGTENFLNAFNVSTDRLFSLLVECEKDLNNPKLNSELFAAVVSSAHSLLDCWERRDIKKSLDPTEVNIMNAFRFANNQIKHNINLIEVHKRTGGISFPMVFPLVIPQIQFMWTHIDRPVEEEFVSKWQIYCDNLEGKTIKDSFDAASKILKNAL